MTQRQGVFRAIEAAAALLQTIAGSAPIAQAGEPPPRRASGETVSNCELQPSFATDGLLRVVRTADDIAIQRRLIGREATR
jgi:hypothetical protein